MTTEKEYTNDEVIKRMQDLHNRLNNMRDLRETYPLLASRCSELSYCLGIFGNFKDSWMENTDNLDDIHKKIMKSRNIENVEEYNKINETMRHREKLVNELMKPIFASVGLDMDKPSDPVH